MRLQLLLSAYMLLTMGIMPQPAKAVEHAGTFSVNRLGLIPLPRKAVAYEAKWKVPAILRIVARRSADHDVATLARRFFKHRGVTAQIVVTGPAEIHLSTSAGDSRLGHEGYRLTVGTHGVRIIANAGAGLFYGLQTFEQLFNPAVQTDNAIHQVRITDWPRYRWRGVMLDSVRHFFPVSVVKKFIRVAAHYKLNVFHWHLTDDQGWRFPVPQYPLLTTIGAWRPNSTPFCSPPAAPDGPRYGGYYTAAQIKAVVAYARRRYVTIVPEIDIPGHSRAAIAAYPWLAGGTAMPPINTPLVPDSKTFAFLKTVFGDLASMFPGKFIHIGGDEVDMRAWMHDPSAEALMRQRHWTLEQVHDYFARTMARFLVTKERVAVVWNDVPARWLPASTIVECWNSSRIVLQDAKLGHNVIVARSGKLYLDHCQGDPKYEKYPTGGVTTLREIYEFNPSSLLPATLRKRLLGAEGCLWTEYVPTPRHLFYQLLPREMALSEICWTPLKEQQYAGFVDRTAKQYLWLRHNNYNFRIPPPAMRFMGPNGHTIATRNPQRNLIGYKTTCLTGIIRIADPVPGAVIHYTLDGEIPNAESPRYEHAIAVALAQGKTVTVRSVAVDPSGRTSAPSRLILQMESGH
jgi:hexosaminidase